MPKHRRKRDTRHGGGVHRVRRMQPRRRKSRREKPLAPPARARQAFIWLRHWRAASPFARSAHPLAPVPTRVGGNAFPEGTELVDACFRRVAGNQRPIDGADRDAGDPIGIKTGLGQCLVDPGLIRTERAAALKQERHALEGRTRSSPMSIAAIGGDRERFGHLTSPSRTRRAHSAGIGNTIAVGLFFRPTAASISGSPMPRYMRDHAKNQKSRPL